MTVERGTHTGVDLVLTVAAVEQLLLGEAVRVAGQFGVAGLGGGGAGKGDGGSACSTLVFSRSDQA